MNSCKTIFTLASILALATGCGTFHGRVVDQNDDPVPKAEVCVSYTTPSLTGCLLPFLPDWNSVVHHRWKTIRKDGTFRVIGFHGYNWRISTAHAARKTGYEYQHAVEHDPEKDFYLIRMRQRTNPCFLHHAPHTSYQFKIPGRTVAVDFIENESIQIDPPKKRPNASTLDLPTLTYDLEIDARFNQNNGAWDVVLASPSDGGGLIAMTNTVYQAPSSGYSDQLSFSIPVSRQATMNKKCLIIRSRTLSVFTRLDVTGVVSTDQFLRLLFDRYTNPYGDPSLDIDPRTEKDFSVRKKLIEDSQEAWQQGHPPNKPDFPTLLKHIDEFK